MIVVFGSIRLWLEERRSQVLDRQTFFKGRGFLRVIYIGVAYLMEQVKGVCTAAAAAVFFFSFFVRHIGQLVK